MSGSAEIKSRPHRGGACRHPLGRAVDRRLQLKSQRSLVVVRWLAFVFACLFAFVFVLCCCCSLLFCFAFCFCFAFFFWFCSVLDQCSFCSLCPFCLLLSLCFLLLPLALPASGAGFVPLLCGVSLCFGRCSVLFCFVLSNRTERPLALLSWCLRFWSCLLLVLLRSDRVILALVLALVVVLSWSDACVLVLLACQSSAFCFALVLFLVLKFWLFCGN